MILLVHMLLGAAAGSLTHNPYLGFLLALISHYLADTLPHIEYLDSVESSIHGLKTDGLKKSLPQVAKVLADFSLGLLAIFLLRNNPIFYAYAIAGVIPDGLTVISKLFPNKISSAHDVVHTQTLHYLTKKKRFPVFWKIFSQILVGVLSMAILVMG